MKKIQIDDKNEKYQKCVLKHIFNYMNRFGMVRTCFACENMPNEDKIFQKTHVFLCTFQNQQIWSIFKVENLPTLEWSHGSPKNRKIKISSKMIFFTPKLS